LGLFYEAGEGGARRRLVLGNEAPGLILSVLPTPVLGSPHHSYSESTLRYRFLVHPQMLPILNTVDHQARIMIAYQ
jgi:hypothetical protein